MSLRQSGDAFFHVNWQANACIYGVLVRVLFRVSHAHNVGRFSILVNFCGMSKTPHFMR